MSSTIQRKKNIIKNSLFEANICLNLNNNINIVCACIQFTTIESMFVKILCFYVNKVIKSLRIFTNEIYEILTV